MLEWDIVLEDDQWRWHILHNGYRLPNGSFRRSSLELVHSSIAQGRQTPEYFAKEIIEFLAEVGFFTTLSLAEISDFLKDWASRPF